jgi:hypothetical protein
MYLPQNVKYDRSSTVGGFALLEQGGARRVHTASLCNPSSSGSIRLGDRSLPTRVSPREVLAFVEQRFKTMRSKFS